MSEPNKNIWSRISYWLIEIAIVFIGVYLAFLFNSYRVDQQNQHKEQQIYKSLYRSFSRSAELKKKNSAVDSLYIDPFFEAYENNEMPRLKKWPFLTLGINQNTWNAMLQSGGLNVLDVELVEQVSDFYYFVELLRQQSTHFNEMSDEYLLPNIDANINTFYNTETKEIRPKYEWYIIFLRYFKNAIDRLTNRSKKILEKLRERMSEENIKEMDINSELTQP